MHIDQARIGGHRIRYGIRQGDSARVPLLILNGLGANIELVQPFVDALPDATIAIFDVPGVGGSPTPPSPYRAPPA
jgi:pimeloyl-ACP methyl ester carboxylesterase